MFIESKIFRVGQADRVGDVLKVQNLIMRTYAYFSLLLSRVGAHVKNAAITSGKTLYQTSPIFNFHAKTLILITVLFQLGNGNAFVFITALEVKSLHSEFFHLPK